VVSSASAEEDFENLMKPVLVRFDDYDQVAFELERNGHQSVVFLPGAPSAWSGGTVVVNSDRVQALNLPAHQAVKLMRTFGRGTLAARASLDASHTPQA
jgi:uncharacterized membrane protein